MGKRRLKPGNRSRGRMSTEDAKLSVPRQQQGGGKRPATRCTDSEARFSGDLACPAQAPQLHHGFVPC